MSMPQGGSNQPISRILGDIKRELKSALAASVPAPSTQDSDSAPYFDYDVEQLLAFDDDAAFVRNAYRCLFRRDPDPGGFECFVGLLRSQKMSKIEILQRLHTSGEGRRHKVQIIGMDWQKFLESRLPHPSGSKPEAPPMQGSPNVNSATLSLEEFDHLRDREFVLAVYRALLAQTPDPQVASNWADMLSSGNITRWEVASALAGSAEGRAAGAPMPDDPRTVPGTADVRKRLSAFQLQIHECALTIDHLKRLNAELRLRCRARQGACGPEHSEFGASR